MNSNNSILKLRKSYKEVGDETWENNDFIEASVKISRNFFTSESVFIRKPRPKKLDVYALVSGISFPEELTEKLSNIQHKIDNILKESLHYWVTPLNFGIEYCVFKWPDDLWDDSWLQDINREINSINKSSFQLEIKGVQINSDGCVLAKGYDKADMINTIRQHLKSNLLFLPKKQSAWAHIPMGRILEPIGTKKFKELKNLIDKLNDILIDNIIIDSAKLVHETRWYMEEKKTLSEFYF